MIGPSPTLYPRTELVEGEQGRGLTTQTPDPLVLFIFIENLSSPNSLPSPFLCVFCGREKEYVCVPSMTTHWSIGLVVNRGLMLSMNEKQCVTDSRSSDPHHIDPPDRVLESPTDRPHALGR